MVGSIFGLTSMTPSFFFAFKVFFVQTLKKFNATDSITFKSLKDFGVTVCFVYAVVS